MKVVFDIDGTLANPGHRLHFIQPKGEDCSVCDSWGGNLPGARVHDRDHTRSGSCTYAKKDWDGFFAACGDDTPIFPTVQLCRDLLSLIMDNQFMVVDEVEFWTGRNEDVRLVTQEWLEDHLHIPAHDFGRGFPLKMRSKGDRRPDHITKMEFIDPLNPPDLIFEDRSTVVRAYRERGLTVFQVAEGDF